MTVAEYFPAAVAAALGPGVVVRAVRFESAREAAGPSVLWRFAGVDRPATIDFGGGPVTVGQRQLFFPPATIGIAGFRGPERRVEDLEFSCCC